MAVSAASLLTQSNIDAFWIEAAQEPSGGSASLLAAKTVALAVISTSIAGTPAVTD